MSATESRPYPIWWLGGIPVIICPAEIDVANAGGLATALQEAGSAAVTVVVDLAGTVFCDCSALGVLAPAQRRAVARGGEVRLVIRSASVSRLFAVTGLDKAFPCYPSLAEAVRAAPCPGPASSGPVGEAG